MSRGPGKIERAIIAAFEREPDSAFTIEDLCGEAYPGINRAEKKHRVAVIRSVNAVAARCTDFGILETSGRGNAIILFRRDRMPSLTVAMAKARAIHGYQFGTEDVAHALFDIAAARRAGDANLPESVKLFPLVGPPAGRIYKAMLGEPHEDWRAVVDRFFGLSKSDRVGMAVGSACEDERNSADLRASA